MLAAAESDSSGSEKEYVKKSKKCKIKEESAEVEAVESLSSQKNLDSSSSEEKVKKICKKRKVKK